MYYYWYDHLQRENIPTIIKAIEDSIKNKDYNSFLFFYSNQNLLNIELPFINKEDFNNIIDSEFECG